MIRTLCAIFLFGVSLLIPPDLYAQTAPVAEPAESAEGQQPWPDPLESFNTKMFWVNRKLDDYFLHPVASAYADVMPEAARRSVGRFFDNVGVIPRFANNLFQFRVKAASIEVARFGINSTLGVAGFFDPADWWFGLKEQPNDFGLTLGRYGVGMGPYLMLPFFGPSDIRDTVGLVADGAMNPMDYLVPWWVTFAASGGEDVTDAINYRSLHLDLFEEVDRYAVDLYGAVQDGYLEHRVSELKKVESDQ